MTPLMFAAMFRAHNAVKVLKEWNKNVVNKQDTRHFIAMTEALFTRDQSLIEELIPSIVPTWQGLREIYKAISLFQIRMTGPLKNFIKKTITTGRKHLEILKHRLCAKILKINY